MLIYDDLKLSVQADSVALSTSSCRRKYEVFGVLCLLHPLTTSDEIFCVETKIDAHVKVEA
jgi:hypothetical protein